MSAGKLMSLLPGILFNLVVILSDCRDVIVSHILVMELWNTLEIFLY